MSSDTPDPAWFLFQIPVASLLRFLKRKTGQPFEVAPQAHVWHHALREGLKKPLHINLGIPGIESPEHPIEENPDALIAAILLGKETLAVILSVEWVIGVAEGLITPAQLEENEAAMATDLLKSSA